MSFTHFSDLSFLFFLISSLLILLPWISIYNEKKGLNIILQNTKSWMGVKKSQFTSTNW